MKRRILMLVFIVLSLSLFAETLVLIDNTIVTGKLIRATEKEVTIELGKKQIATAPAEDIYYVSFDGSKPQDEGIVLSNGMKIKPKSFDISVDGGIIISSKATVSLKLSDVKSINYSNLFGDSGESERYELIKYRTVTVGKDRFYRVVVFDQGVTFWESVNLIGNKFVMKYRSIVYERSPEWIAAIYLPNDFSKEYPYIVKLKNQDFVSGFNDIYSVAEILCKIISMNGNEIVIENPFKEIIKIPLSDIVEIANSTNIVRGPELTTVLNNGDILYNLFTNNQSTFILSGRIDQSILKPKMPLSGVSKVVIEKTPYALLWSFKTNGAIFSSPAIGPDGTVYIGSDDGNLYALNPDGTVKWKFQTAGCIRSTPAISPDGTLYFVSDDGFLYALDTKSLLKRLKWKVNIGSSHVHWWERSSPTIGSDGTIYVGSTNGSLYAITPEGKLKWKFSTGDCIVSSPAISSDGTIYVGSNDRNLYAITLEGKLKWKFSTDDRVISSPAIGSDGTIYVGRGDRNLYAITPEGKLKWKFSTGNGVTSSPAIDSDGTIYVGSVDRNLYAITPDGKLKWKFSTGDRVISPPAIGSDGTIYVGSDDRNLYAITPDGKLKWWFSTGNCVSSSPAISASGVLYFGSQDGRIYAIQTTSFGGLADTPWPKFRGGISNTGNVKYVGK